ncbi:MAG: glycosyltransferase family 4 protein [Bacteroidetes bacterium]|nr:glycosyltransferase family 4 protein [Bacteroidota bacterium]
MKILFFVPYPLGESPSQRFRFEQYFFLLSNEHSKFEVQSFLSSQNWKIFFKKGNSFLKLILLSSGFLRRFVAIFKAIPVDFIFIHRECAPIGPPIFEWIIAKVFQKKIIYDFDDAIWLTDKTNEHWLERTIRWRKKVSSICKWSYKVSTGNPYLAAYAKRFNENVVVNPTTIDTENTHQFHGADRQSISSQRVVIGWTGSHSTLKYLNEIEQVLISIEKKFPFVEFWFIADQPPKFNLERMHFKLWSLQTEIIDLSQFDIGIMPLPDDEWTRGKCGFKILQYMALQIPTVASPVGANPSIIDQGVNGYIANNDYEWKKMLSALIESKELRQQLGVAGKKTVEQKYSVNSNKKLFLGLFTKF